MTEPALHVLDDDPGVEIDLDDELDDELPIVADDDDHTDDEETDR